jgi:hypothetical protein
MGYCIINNILYQRSTSTPLLKCFSLEESTYVLREIQEEIYGFHTNFKALATQTT